MSAPTAQRLARGQPARGLGGHAAGRLVGRPVGPQRARAEPHEHDVARAQLDALGRALELLDGDRVPVGQPLDPERARHVEQHAARDDRRDGVDRRAR